MPDIQLIKLIVLIGYFLSIVNIGMITGAAIGLLIKRHMDRRAFPHRSSK